ncbi:hypothetical protein BDC45DRAFT_122974 [Circinella umbellata]|nr:hypothetical protein BDC45DRAFT_122974 [Circinella umbellata]
MHKHTYITIIQNTTNITINYYSLLLHYIQAIIMPFIDTLSLFYFIFMPLRLWCHGLNSIIDKYRINFLIAIFIFNCYFFYMCV